MIAIRPCPHCASIVTRHEPTDLCATSSSERESAMQVTEHFTLEEMIESQMAARLGIDNTPSEEIIAHLRHLCETILEPARQALGPLRISSGYRCAAVDDAIPRAVPNVRPSAHRFGWAADVIPAAVSKLTFARWVHTSVLYDQIILEYGAVEEPAWIHVSAEPLSRGQVLRILAGRGYETVTL